MSDTPYFTPDQARAQESALSNSTTYPDDLIDAMRVTVETDIEKACGVAFVPRTCTEILTAPRSDELVVAWSRPVTVTACSVDDYTFTDDDIAALEVYPDGVITRDTRWTRRIGRRSMVRITYTHGYSDGDLPGRVVRDAIKLTKRWLVETPINDRATQLVNPDGTTQWFVTAGVGQALYDIPEVNALVVAYGERGIGA